MDVMAFLGREGWQAFSLDPTGANLPSGHGPWTPLRLGRATAAHELDALRAYGFTLMPPRGADNEQETEPRGPSSDPDADQP